MIIVAVTYGDDVIGDDVVVTLLYPPAHISFSLLFSERSMKIWLIETIVPAMNPTTPKSIMK